MTKTYFAIVEGFIDTEHRKVGDRLMLTERQAKYLLLNGLISETPPPDPSEATAPTKKAKASD